MLTKEKLKSRSLTKVTKKDNSKKIQSLSEENNKLITEINEQIIRFKNEFFSSRFKMLKTNKQNLEFIKDHITRCEDILKRS